jgi:hypothetical protein
MTFPFESVAPMLPGIGPDLRFALTAGVAYADSLQPENPDPYFHAASARWAARNALIGAKGDEWEFVPDVANCGLLFRVRKIHLVRVLRSEDRMTPSSGHSRTRSGEYERVATQLALPLDGELSPLNLIVDWFIDEDRDPVLHVGLPKNHWRYQQRAKLFWREPFPDGTLSAYEGLRFPTADDDDDTGVEIILHEGEIGGREAP